MCACAEVCVRHRACLCMRARQPTACMIRRMQTRAYVDVGAGVGVSVGEGVAVDVGAGVAVGEAVGVDVVGKAVRNADKLGAEVGTAVAIAAE